MHAVIIGVFGVSIALITFARRYKNSDDLSGVGIAGWGTIILCVMSIIAILSYS